MTRLARRYDKVASILGLGYPGGPIIDNLAKGGDPKSVQLPRTWLEPGSLDFSFSGIKTAVLYHVHGPGKTTGGLEKLTEQHKADICASFQAAVVDVLVGKGDDGCEADGRTHGDGRRGRGGKFGASQPDAGRVRQAAHPVAPGPANVLYGQRGR